MTASRSSRGAASRLAASAGAALCVLAFACRSPGGDAWQPPPDAVRDDSATWLLDPLPARAPHPPGVADLAAVELAANALASRSDPELERALARLRRAGEARAELVSLGTDVVHAASDGPAAYVEHAERLARSREINPAHRHRLETTVADDPLRLANRRLRDGRVSVFAQTFNTVSEPLGKTLMTGVVAAPLTIATSVAHWIAGLFERDPISLQERQALVHWKTYLARNPDAPERAAIERKIASAEARLARTHRERLVRSGRRALRSGRPRLARALSDRALDHAPRDETASTLRDRASEEVGRQRLLHARSLGARVGPGSLELERKLAEALWTPGADVARQARALRAADPRGPLADEAEFVLATIQHEAGLEAQGWERLERLARRSPERANMARHADALVANPWQNAYRSFRDLRRNRVGRETAWRTLGPFSRGPRYRKIPKAIAYLIDAPAILRTVITTPVRMIVSAFQPKPDFERPAALAAYTYLGRHPDGERAGELVEWLFEYEKGRDNWPGALRLADFQPDFDAGERADLVERAAALQLERASELKRPDLRHSMLRNVVQEFPDSDAGHSAGIRARQELTGRSPLRIQLTRGFLRENPRILGPAGVGLNRTLWDGREENGELHTEGISFVGGRWLEFSLLEEDDDDDAEPLRIRRRVSAERLARVVALVDETSRHNAAVDLDDELASDADRDAFFERARLGLADQPDLRSTARSTYVYRGVRERYGVVRGRESLLPFDLVLRGSLGDLSLGAFPRWRQPKLTPDAFLYR